VPVGVGEPTNTTWVLRRPRVGDDNGGKVMAGRNVLVGDAVVTGVIVFVGTKAVWV